MFLSAEASDHQGRAAESRHVPVRWQKWASRLLDAYHAASPLAGCGRTCIIEYLSKAQAVEDTAYDRQEGEDVVAQP